MPFWKQEPTIEDLEEQNQRKELELSLAQKQAAIAKLKQAGLTTKSFGNRWSAIWTWVKSH